MLVAIFKAPVPASGVVVISSVDAILNTIKFTHQILSLLLFSFIFGSAYLAIFVVMKKCHSLNSYFKVKIKHYLIV